MQNKTAQCTVEVVHRIVAACKDQQGAGCLVRHYKPGTKSVARCTVPGTTSPARCAR